MKKAGVLRLAALGFAALGLAACGDTVTEIRYLETDTYITNQSDQNHSELPQTLLYANGGDEQRVLLRLPTAEADPWTDDIDSFDDFLLTFFFMPIRVLAALMACDTDVLSSTSLTDADLVFNDANGTLAGGNLRLELLAKPWWQDVTWTRAHPFSKRGIWETPGGDVDSSYTFGTNGYNAGEVSWDVTTYFRALINSNGNMEHFGFVIRSDTGTLAQAALHSVQASDSLLRPRLVATYSCPNPLSTLKIHSGARTSLKTGGTSGTSTQKPIATRRTTIFGRTPIFIDEPVYAEE